MIGFVEQGLVAHQLQSCPLMPLHDRQELLQHTIC